MGVLEDAKSKVMELKNSINPTIAKTIEDNKLVIVDYQTQEQLYEGEDNKGSIIRPAYKKITVKIKQKKGQPFDRVTWKDTGRLYKNIKVIVRDDEFEVIADVEYSKQLITKYGDNVLGIQNTLMKQFVEKYIFPNIKKEFDDTISKP